MTEYLAQRIRRAREREGLTQAALAKKLGVTQGSIAQWEGGKEPSAANKRELETVLGALTPSNTMHDKTITEEASSYGSWLHEQRVQKSLSVPELARRANVSAPAIYNIEGGKIQNPQASTRERLEVALGVSAPDRVVAETEESQNVLGLGSLQDFDPHDDKNWPKCSGVYVLYDISQRPIYVGKGRNIGIRLKSHHSAFWFKSPIVQHASYIEVVDKSLRHQLEQVLIRFLKSNAVINQQSTEQFGED